MKISEAITKGIPFVPAGRRSYFTFVGATQDDYAEGVAHHKPLARADALGTAIVGLAGDPVRAAEECYEGPHGGPHGLLTTLFPDLTNAVSCPVCHNAAGEPFKLFNLLWHLQDRHGWNRQEVAGWLQEEGH